MKPATPHTFFVKPAPSTPPHAIRFLVSPASIARVLLGIAVLLTGLSLIGLYLRLYTDYVGAHRFVRYAVDKLNLDNEQSIPTFYAVALLLLSSALLWLASRLSTSAVPLRGRWLILAVIFLGMAIDEATSLHELLNEYGPQIYPSTSIYLHWVWVIPYGLFTAVIFVLYVPFLRMLPRRTAGTFLLAGCIYVGGALGVEMLSSAIFVVEGWQNLSYGLTTHLEEFLEMAGLTVFIYGLANYLTINPLTITTRRSGEVGAGNNGTARTPAGAGMSMTNAQAVVGPTD